MKHTSRFFLAALAGAVIAGCGSDDKDDSAAAAGPTTATGQFKDSNTAGLAYTSGGISSVTNANGQFTYVVGQPITFRVGGLTLGTATGAPVITPTNLRPGDGSAAATHLAEYRNNLVRLLMLLDADHDAATGIQIPPAVSALIPAGTNFNLDVTTDIAADATLDTLLAAAGVDTSSWPTAADATNHLEGTLACAYAGAFEGVYTGGDNGRFGLLINTDGTVIGMGWNDTDRFVISSLNTLDVNNSGTFVSGIAGSASFNGSFPSGYDGISGDWTNTDQSTNGTFSGRRIGGAWNAEYRFTGHFVANSGDTAGLFTLDIAPDRSVSGLGYDFEDGAVLPITGALNPANELTATASGGVTIGGNLNLASGVITNGFWYNSSEQGTYTGSGCRLN